MFQLSSYLLRPEITITNLEDASMHPEKYFVNINKVLEIRRIFPKLDSNYLNGAILIQFGDEIILDFKFWELVDQLWGYFLNALDDLRNKGEASFYFPDQPIFIEMRNLPNAVILFSVDKKKWMLPRDEFFKGILEGAVEFFVCINQMYDSNKYSFELMQIEELKQFYIR